MRRRPREDDTAGLAGWLYTDLLLGLAVIFLGAIAFSAATKPEESATPITTTTTSTTTTTTPPTTLPPVPCTMRAEQVPRETRVKLATNVSDEQLRQEFEMKVTEVLSRIGLPLDSRVGFALVFGAGRTDNDGERQAAALADRLRMLSTQRFGTTGVRPLHDASLNNAVNIDLFFLVGDCS